MRTLKSLLTAVALCLGLITTLGAQASVISSTGTFATDDEIQIFNFSLSSMSAVSARTWSFGGGVNAAGNTIAAGSFAPLLTLFDANGTQDLLQSAIAGASGSCPPGANTDLVSGFCWDVGIINFTLNAGDYFFVLTQDGNTPFGPSFADGFQYAGQGDYTGPNYLGQSGQCILIDGSQRSCAWALDISLPQNNVPEPDTLALLAAGFAGLSRLRKRTL